MSSPAQRYWTRLWVRFRQKPIAVVGLGLIVAIVTMALIGPEISGYSYYGTHLELANTPPGALYWFGSDDLGRDLFTRVWCGARISLLVAFAAAAIDLVIGVLWGGIAGFIGGKTDEALMRLADVLYAIPYLLVVILLTVAMGGGLLTLIVAMTITGWIAMARQMRGQVMLLKKREFVLAAKALGASGPRILLRHIIPNALGPIIVTLTFTIPAAIFTEAFLSFLGLGVQAPIASWGTLASEGLPALRYYPWRLLIPAAFISLTLFAFYTVGDRLGDATDPKEEEA